MRMCNFDFVYKNLQAGIFTEEQAAKEIMKLIFQNPPLFGTAKLNEDDRSEFLLYLYPVLVKLHSNYEPDKSPYMAYVHLFIQLALKSWQKSHLKKSSGDECYIQYYHSDFDDEETKSYLSEPENIYSSKPFEKYEQKLLEKNEQEITVYNKILKKVKKLPSRDLLIIALKSSWYLQDHHIECLSRHTGLSADSLWNLKRSLEKTMTRRIELSQKRSLSRNSSFYRRSKAMLELNRIDQHSMCYAMLQNSFLYHDKFWRKKNTAQYRRSICPNNKEIAALLHLQNFEVDKSLRRAKRYAEILES